MSNKLTCHICGDIASGFNYSVLSCVSCKTFFHRNAWKNKEYKCILSDGKCIINVLTRKFCLKCRLERCFDLGMKKEYLLSDEEKELRSHKIQMRKKMRQVQTSTSESTDLVMYENDILDEIFNDNNISEEDVNKEIMNIEKSLKINDLNSCEPDLSIIPVLKPITDYSSNFTEQEFYKLTELLNATKHMKPEINDCFNTYETKDYFHAYTLWAPYAEILIPSIVQMSKNLNLFRDICEDDQVTLLKYGAFDLIMLRIIENFNAEKQTWKVYIPQGYVAKLHLDVMKEYNLYDLSKMYLSSILEEWDSDSIVMDLLTVISLFNPNRPDLKYREVIKYQQYIYVYLLNRYLILKYRSESICKSKSERLINCTELVRHISRRSFQIITEQKNKFKAIVGPMLREIHDID